jgi:DnaJ domain
MPNTAPDPRLTQLRTLVQQAIADYISPVIILTMTPSNGTVTGTFRSGMQTFSYAVNGKGVVYKPLRPGVAPAPKRDSLEVVRVMAYAEARARLDARNCTKGTACGSSCIPQGRQCRKKSSTPAQKARTEEIAKLAGGGPAGGNGPSGGALATRGGALARREPDGDKGQDHSKAEGGTLEDRYRGRNLTDQEVDEYAAAKLKELTAPGAMGKTDGTRIQSKTWGINGDLIGKSDQAAAAAYDEHHIGAHKANLEFAARDGQDAMGNSVTKATKALEKAQRSKAKNRDKLIARAKADLETATRTRDDARERLANWIPRLEAMSTEEKAAAARTMASKLLDRLGDARASDLKQRAKSAGPAAAIAHHLQEEEGARYSRKSRLGVLGAADEKTEAEARDHIRQHLAGGVDSVLGLTRGKKPTPEQLKSAYRKAAAKAHPDAGGSPEQFRQVTQAYEDLKRRYNYDSVLGPAFRMDSPLVQALARHAHQDSGDWIAAATANKGGLHRALGVPEGKDIPAAAIAKAAKRPGRVGREARLAQTLERMHHDDACSALGVNGSVRPTEMQLRTAYRRARAQAGRGSDRLDLLRHAYDNLMGHYGYRQEATA